MARPVKRGPGPVAIAILVLVVMATGGGIAVWLLKPQLPLDSSIEFPEVPKVELPQELPFSLPWKQESAEDGKSSADEKPTSDAAPSDDTGVPEGTEQGAIEGATVPEVPGLSTDFGQVDDVASEPGSENAEASTEPVGVEQGEGEIAVSEADDEYVVPEPTPEPVVYTEPIATPDL